MRVPLLVAAALVASLGSVAHAGRGAAALKLLADDTKLVVLVDVARARSSVIFKRGLAFATQKEPLLATFAVDTHVDTIVLGASDKDGTHAVIVLEGKVDKLLAVAKTEATATATHAGITYWSTRHGDVALLGKRIVIAATGDMPQVIDRSLDKKRRKGPSMARGVIAATPASAAVVVGILPDGSMRKDISKQLGAEPRAVTLAVGMATKVTYEGRFQFADEATAKAAASVFEQTLSAELRDRAEGLVGKEFADSIAVDWRAAVPARGRAGAAPRPDHRDHAMARVSATMNVDEVDRILAMLRLLM